jgi:hypothetical protein
MISQISRAERELNNYTEEQVSLVEECYEDVIEEISEWYMRDDGSDVGHQISSVKRDWMLQAIEDDLLTEEEFDKLYDLVDTVHYREAAAYA